MELVLTALGFVVIVAVLLVINSKLKKEKKLKIKSKRWKILTEYLVRLYVYWA